MFHTTWRRRGRMALWAGALLLLTATGARAAEAVGLEVSVIHATRKGDGVDPKLARIRKDLEKAFGGYTSFKQLSKSDLKLVAGRKTTLKLPNGEAAEFTYKGKEKGSHLVRLAIPRSKVEVDLRAPLEKMFYQAGIKHAGGILILALHLGPAG